jgi:plasmid stabilization system protein ParE
MRIVYHRLAVRDVRQILDHYESEAGIALADRFFVELLATLEKALANPSHFPPLDGSVRRANLEGFPYHFLYVETLWGIKVTVVRHHRRNPDFGRRRK